MYLKIVFPSLLQQFWKCLKWLYHMYKSLVLHFGGKVLHYIFTSFFLHAMQNQEAF